MGDLKIASVSAPPLGRGDATAADTERKQSPSPPPPVTATTSDSSSSSSSSSTGSANGTHAVKPPPDAAATTTSEATKLAATEADTVDGMANSSVAAGDVTAVSLPDAPSDVASVDSDDTTQGNEMMCGDASADDVVPETTASDESDAVATDDHDRASIDEPSVQPGGEDPTALANEERDAAVDNDEPDVKTPQSEVQRKRKRSKRLGFSGSRPKQKRQSACPPLHVQLPDAHESNQTDAPESPIFHEPAALYPSAPSEGAWDWSMSNVYYDPISQENVNHLVRARKSCANIIAANVDAFKGSKQATTEIAHLTTMLQDANDALSARVRPLRRGRRYRDVWEEEDFLSLERKRDGLSVNKKCVFSDQDALLSNHELVHGYDDELFEKYIGQLEEKAGCHQQASGGTTDASKTPLAAAASGSSGSASKSDKCANAKAEPARKAAKQKNQKQASLAESVVPGIPLHESHPAAWGNWTIKKQTTCFEVIHPASLWRKMVPRRWKEESEALETLKAARGDDKDSAAEDDDKDAEAECDPARPLAGQRAVPIATALWGNGKDDVTTLPSFGAVIEDDEISREIAASLAKLLPLSMYNWRVAQTVFERAATYAQCSPVLQQEAALVKRIEELYQRLYPARASENEPADTAQREGRAPVFHSHHADLITHSLKFCRDSDESHCVAASVEYSLTLQVGDEVDVLDKNGCWNDGVVIDVFREDGRLVKYVLLRLSLWDASAVEWVSVIEGRILPRGVADGKMAFSVGPTRFRKRRIEFNRVLADSLEKTFSVRHVEQYAAAVTRRSEIAAGTSEQAEDTKLQRKKARRAL